MAGVIQHLLGQVLHNVGGLFRVAGPGIDLPRRVAKRAAGIAGRASAAVGNHVRHLRGIVAAVAGVHVLDRLLAPPRFDVEVDVGWSVAFRGEETLEEQAGRHSVHRRDPQRKADRGVRRGSSPLAEDVVLVAEGNDVVDDQEVAREAQLLDRFQLAVDGGPRLVGGGRGSPLAVAFRATAFGDRAQPGHLRIPRRHGEVRQVRCNEVQGEGAFVGDLHGGLHGPRQPFAIARELQHLFPRAQPRSADGVGGRLRGGDVPPFAQRRLRPSQPGMLRGRARRGTTDDLA